MNRIPFDDRDILHKVVTKVFRDLLSNIPSQSNLDDNAINAAGAQVCRYRDLHDLQTEARKNSLPALGSLTRDDIRAALAIGLRRVTGIDLIQAFRATGKARLRLLSVDRRTREYLEEQKLAELQKAQESQGTGKLIVLDECWRAGPDNVRQRHKGALIEAGAPDHYLTVRADGLAFEWGPTYALYQIIHSNPMLLDGEPAISDCTSPEEAVETYAREVLVPESWVPIRSLVGEGLEVPDYEVIALYNGEGIYIGRVLRHRWHRGIIPCLYYTDLDLLNGKVELLCGRRQSNAGFADYGQERVSCTSPVYCASSLDVGVPTLPSIKDVWTPFQVPAEDLKLLNGVFCGAIQVTQGSRSTSVWAIDGDQYALQMKDWSVSLQQTYFSTLSWRTEGDFPLLYPVRQPQRVEGPARGRVRYAGMREQRVILPAEVVDLQKGASRLMRFGAQDVAVTLNLPGSESELLPSMLSAANASAMEASAQAYFEACHVVGEDYDEDDVAEETIRRALWRQQALDLLPDFFSLMSARFPYLQQFGMFTTWYVMRGIDGDLENVSVDELTAAEVLVHLVLLTSATVAGVRPDWFTWEAASLAVGRWVDARSDLKSVHDLAGQFESYGHKLYQQGRMIRRVSDEIARRVKNRGYAKALRVAFVTDKVSTIAYGKESLQKLFTEGRTYRVDTSKEGSSRQSPNDFPS